MFTEVIFLVTLLAVVLTGGLIVKSRRPTKYVISTAPTSTVRTKIEAQPHVYATVFCDACQHAQTLRNPTVCSNSNCGANLKGQ